MIPEEDLADAQITTEERIAAHVFDAYRGRELSEGDAADVGRAVLYIVLSQLSAAEFAALKEVVG